MTEEAKRNLLNYMLGKMPDESGLDTVLAPTISQINNDLAIFIKKNYPDLSTLWEIAQLIVRGDYIILWCNDYITDKESPSYGQWKKSFVVVLDKKYIPLKYIDEFDSGTPLAALSRVDQNDVGTGNIYGVDTIFKRDTAEIDRLRVVIINDFTLENFKIKLLNSYNIPKYDNHQLIITQIFKNPSEGKYFLSYYYTTGSTDTGDTTRLGGGLEFVNNVGSENEWNFYPYIGSKRIFWNGIERWSPTWSGDGLSFKGFTEYKVDQVYNGNSIAILTLKSQADGDSKSCVDDMSVNLPADCKNVGQLSECAINLSSVLVATTTTSSELSSTVYIIQYQLSTLSHKIWYSKEDYIDTILEDGFIASYDDMTLFAINNQFYFLRLYRHYKATHDADYNYTYEYYNNDLYLDQIYNNELTEFFVKDFEQQDNVNFKLLISNIFNLYNFGLIFQNVIISLTQIYNPSNYNGESFNNVNSLNSNSAVLYSDNNPVFARNLYNKTQNGVTTMSTIEVPYNYLNDVLVDKMDLRSENNNVIISNTNGFTKNIYETVYLNFVNTISIVNNNGPQPIYNPTAATELNTSINNPEDYDNLKLTKYKINYQDGTNIVSNLQATLQDDGSYELLMTFFLNKTANSLELISEDEKTSYLTYDLSNVELNKIYSYNQRVRIGG